MNATNRSERVISRVRASPPGLVSTYKDIEPGSPRLVGRVLAEHWRTAGTRGCASDVAWHRVKTMKEAYAVKRTVPPSAEIQADIDRLLAKGMVDDPQKMLGDLARLGARLIIQRAVEEEFDTWLGRARYERRPDRERGLKNCDSGLRNGFRPRHLQTGEGELEIQIPQARHTTVPFVSKLFPKWHCKRLFRTDPLKTLVIGGFVRGLSMRDIESLCEEVGLGSISRSTVARICAELHERFEAFKGRSL
jgi:alkylated DNA nucleotide flippase Atl1